MVATAQVSRWVVAPSALDFDARRARQRLLPRLEAAGGEGTVPIVSWERLSGAERMGGYDSKELADRLAAVFPEARILLVIREQRAMILSWYKWYLTRGGSGSTQRYFHPRARRTRLALFGFEHFKYDRLIAHYSRLFGRERVMVLPFERLVADPRGSVGDILEFAGARHEPDALARLLGEPRNRSRSTLALTLGRPVNALLGWDHTRDSPPGLLPTGRLGWIVGKRVTSALARWQPRVDSLLPAPLSRRFEARIRRQVAAAVGDRYARSNARTQALTGLDLAGLGYMVGRDEAPPVGAVIPVEGPPRSALTA
jgi:hypothetical protein